MYIDDMVVKSKLEEQIPNLPKIFKILRHNKLCLNAAKCAFRVGSEKFLGYMITCREIKVNPN